MRNTTTQYYIIAAVTTHKEELNSTSSINNALGGTHYTVLFLYQELHKRRENNVTSIAKYAALTSYCIVTHHCLPDNCLYI